MKQFDNISSPTRPVDVMERKIAEGNIVQMKPGGDLIIRPGNADPQEVRASWLKLRRLGLGGSDAAVIMGQAKKKPFALFLEKSELAEEEDLGDREFVRWGSILENPVAIEYAERTKRRIFDPGRHAIVFSEDHPFMHCTIDRKIIHPVTYPDADALVPPGSGPGALSIKCAGEYRREDWEEEGDDGERMRTVPLWAQIQVQHELVVRGWKWGAVAVLIGGNRLWHFDISRNEAFCALLVEKEEEFWDRVRRGDAPPVDESDLTDEILKRMYPEDNGTSIALPIEAYEWMTDLRDLKTQRKEIKEKIQGIENQLHYAIGEATIGMLPPPPDNLEVFPERLRACIETAPANILGLSWRKQSRASYTVPAGEYRVMREERSTTKKSRRK